MLDMRKDGGRAFNCPRAHELIKNVRLMHRFQHLIVELVHVRPELGSNGFVAIHFIASAIRIILSRPRIRTSALAVTISRSWSAALSTKKRLAD